MEGHLSTRREMLAAEYRTILLHCAEIRRPGGMFNGGVRGRAVSRRRGWLAGSVGTEASWMKNPKACIGYALGPIGEVLVAEVGTEPVAWE